MAEEITLQGPVLQSEHKELSGSDGAQNKEGDLVPESAGKDPNSDKEILGEEMLKSISEKIGLEVPSWDYLKEKVTQPEPAPQPKTKEQEEKEEQELEKRAATLFLSSNGATVEQFAQLKSLSSAPALTIGLLITRQELKDQNPDMSDSDIDELIKDQFHLVDDTELALIEDDAERKRQEKKRGIGEKALEKIGEPAKKEANSAIERLKQAIKTQDQESEKASQYGSAMAAQVSGFKQIKTILGKDGNGADLPDIEFDLSEQHIAAISSEIADPQKFESTFFNEDGSPNLGKIIPILAKSIALDDTVKKAYLLGKTDGLNEGRSVLMGSPDLTGDAGQKTAPKSEKLRYVGVTN